jgi:hypothetical protein
VKRITNNARRHKLFHRVATIFLLQRTKVGSAAPT